MKWIQIGNETTYGFLWPMAHTPENMKQYAGLYSLHDLITSASVGEGITGIEYTVNDRCIIGINIVAFAVYPAHFPMIKHLMLRRLEFAGREGELRIGEDFLRVHGAGTAVPWDEADAFMHLPFQKDLDRREVPTPAAGGAAAAYHGTREEDLALEKIFERTYGPVKARQLVAPPTAAAQRQQDPEEKSVSDGEILLIPVRKE